jgi:hypothetical protein
MASIIPLKASPSGALLASGARRILYGMNDSTRFEIRIPATSRRELDALADEAGLSSAFLVRLAIRRLLKDGHVELKLPQPDNGRN